MLWITTMIENKKFNSRNKFKLWLKKCSKIILLGLTLSQGAVEVNTTWQQATQIIKNTDIKHFPKAKYEVTFERLTEQSNEEDNEISYFRTLLAMPFEHKKFGIDQISSVKEVVVNYEYITLDKGSDNILTFIIKQPEDPLELEELITNLRKTDAFTAIDLGTGYMEEVYLYNQKKEV